MRTFGLALAIRFLTLLESAPRSPEAIPGEAATYACPSGSVMIGIQGRQGQWMDGVKGVCAKLATDGGVDRTSTTSTTYVGGTGGTSGTYYCAPGYVVAGFAGSQGTYVNSIHSLTCAPWSAATRTGGNNVTARSAFAQKGGTFLSELCTYGRVSTGIEGSAKTVKEGIWPFQVTKTYLATFGVSCNYAPGATIPQTAARPQPGAGGDWTGTTDPNCTIDPATGRCR